MKNLILLASVSSMLSGCFTDSISGLVRHTFERTVTKREGDTVTIIDTYTLTSKNDQFKAKTIINDNKIFDIGNGGVIEGNFINKSEKISGPGLRAYEGTLMNTGSKIQGDAINEKGVFAMENGQITGKVTNQEERENRGFIINGGAIDGDFQNDGRFVYYGENGASIGGKFENTKTFTLYTSAKPLAIKQNLTFKTGSSIVLIINSSGFKDSLDKLQSIVKTPNLIDFNNAAITIASTAGSFNKDSVCSLFEGGEIQNFTAFSTDDFSILQNDKRIIIKAKKDINKALPYKSMVSSFDLSAPFQKTSFNSLFVASEENAMGVRYNINKHISSQVIYRTHQKQDNPFCKHFKTLSAHMKAQKALPITTFKLSPYLFTGYGIMFDMDTTLKNNSIVIQDNAAFFGAGIGLEKKLGIFNFMVDGKISKEFSPREIKIGSRNIEYVDIFTSSLILGISSNINENTTLEASGNIEKNHAGLDHRFQINLNYRF